MRGLHPCALAVAALALGACGSSGSGGGGADSGTSGGFGGVGGSGASGGSGATGGMGSTGGTGASGGTAGTGATGGLGGAAGSGGSGAGGATGGTGGGTDAGSDAGCVPGTQDTVACGKCGTQDRTCDAGGQWQLGPCTGETGVCVAGTQATVPCGNCNLGSRTDYCTASCDWVYGNCGGVPVTACTPNDVKAGPTACPNESEIHASTCKSDCTWSAPAAACTQKPSGWRYMERMNGFTFIGDSVRSVWSGKEMLIFGKQNGGGTTVRAGYDPQTDTWRVLAGDPVGPRIGNVVVWTGTRLFVWGGASESSSQSQCHADGALYDPVANAWEVVPGPTGQGPPTCRNWAVAVWAPATQEVLLWGGASTGGYLADGDAYKPSTKTWRQLPAAPIAAREQAEGFYAGGKLHVFGGLAPGFVGDGASFDPVTNIWQKLPTTPALGPRYRQVAQADASGSAGGFWGGVGSGYLADGASYDAQSSAWTAIPAPSASIVPSAARAYAGGWFGQGKLWFWGGQGSAVWFDDGAAFDVTTKTWSAIPPGGPPASAWPVVAWTGNEALVVGGATAGVLGYNCRIYRP